MTYFPALTDAAKDDALRGTPITVYLTLVTTYLDPVEFRPLKLTGLAFTLRMRRNTVSKALQLLTTRGYLVRRYVARDGYEYRFVPVRRSPLVAQSEHTRSMA